MTRRDKIVLSIAVAAFFALTAFVFAPEHLFLTNAREFNANYLELLGYFLLIALPIFALIAAVLFFLPQRFNVHQKVTAIIFALSFLLWLQGNYLVWNYGLLTGSRIEFNTYFLIADAVLWIAVIALVWIRSAFFYRYAIFLSCVFIAVQIVSTSMLVYNQPDLSNAQRYEIDSTNKFTFSKEQNVIILVLDTFESDVFQQIIDDDESYRDIFDGFTFYRDALACFPTTIASIPNILTGQYTDNSMPHSKFLEKAYLSSSSIPRVLREAGFEFECFGDIKYWEVIYWDKGIVSNLKDRTQVESGTILNIYDAALFRYLPDVLKPYTYNNGKWLLSNIAPAERSISDDNNYDEPSEELEIKFNEKAIKLRDVAFARDVVTDSKAVGRKSIFKFYWLNGCHPPYLLNEKLEYEEMAADGYQRQAKGSLQITKIFLDELKRLEVFDNSMIFVIGDHGQVSDTLQRNAHPLFLVKRFDNEEALEISDAPICLSDVPVTIFTELAINGDFDGENIFNLKESTLRERKFWYYDWFTPGFADWSKDYLPPIREYVVTGPVSANESWRLSGQRYYWGHAEGLWTEWEDGFSVLEGTTENNWRWCSANGTLTITNLAAQEKKVMLKARFVTGHPELANLKIEGILLNDNLTINNAGYFYKKVITVPLGSYTIKFTCDARRLDAPNDPRYIVFGVRNFQLDESE